MILPKRITWSNLFNKKEFFAETILKNSRLFIYIGFILLHLLLLNINAAEWGDSYRILRASEYLRSDSIYPPDEKRPPLYSIVLSIHTALVDPVTWGRIFMLLVSVFYLFVFEKFISLFIKNDKYKNLSLFLFIFNPVILYWSLRIYADTFFGLIVLLTLLLYILWAKNSGLLFKSDSLDKRHISILGILTGLAILTRFEGYLLFGSLGLSLLIHLLFENNVLTFTRDTESTMLDNFKNLLNMVFINKSKDVFVDVIGKISVYVLSTFSVLIPWFLYRNPLDGSSYLAEPAGRSYDLKMFLIYLCSLIFIFGFTSAFYFIKYNIRGLFDFLKSNYLLAIFMVVYLVLVLLWPAAVPRLFVPVLPILILLLGLSLEKFFTDFEKSDNTKIHVVDLYYLVPLFFGYLVFQYYLKLQFLIPTKVLFIIIGLVQVLNIFSISSRNFKLFIYTLFVSCSLWSLFVIWIHKDTFISVKHAAEYASIELTGVIAYNDVSSVSDWYLNQKGRSLAKTTNNYNDNVVGFFYNFEKNELLTFESLMTKELDYLLITNEHNTTLDINLDKRPYLTLVKEFSYNVNGKTFSTRIVKLNKDYIK